MPATWILKTEPSAYNWDQLVRDGGAVWDGVANPQALMHLRAMAGGDEVLIYHSGDGKAIVGVAKIAKAAYPDPHLADPKRVVVEIVPVRPIKAPVTLSAIKAVAGLADLGLVRQGRLSCLPVSAKHRELLRRLGVR